MAPGVQYWLFQCKSLTTSTFEWKGNIYYTLCHLTLIHVLWSLWSMVWTPFEFWYSVQFLTEFLHWECEEKVDILLSTTPRILYEYCRLFTYNKSTSFPLSVESTGGPSVSQWPRKSPRPPGAELSLRTRAKKIRAFS